MRFDLPSEEFTVTVEFIVMMFKSELLGISDKKICFLSPRPRTDKQVESSYTLRIWNTTAQNCLNCLRIHKVNLISEPFNEINIYRSLGDKDIQQSGYISLHEKDIHSV